MLALGPLAHDNDTIVVALRRFVAGAPLNASFTYLAVSLDRKAAPVEVKAERFYSEVLEHAAVWDAAFDTAMSVTVPYKERRQVDMAKGVMVAASTVWIGDQPNYGTGGDYWLSGPPARAMMDTSTVPDSLPLTSLALDTALLQWGLLPSALSKIGFYMDTFIYPNGTIDMGHWKDIWHDGGDGIYNCTFPDGLTDMGRILQLFCDAVRLSRDTSWMIKHLDGALRIGKWLLKARAEAVAAYPPGDLRHGLIWGPAEHDTCTMGMGNGGKPPVPIVDGQRMLYYFSNSMWSWRGMVELGTLLQDYPLSILPPAAKQLGKDLLDEAPKFKRDLDMALNRSVVRDPSSGNITFVPAAVAADASGGSGGHTSVKPYMSMTTDTLASYSNFRYYSEMLSSGAMDLSSGSSFSSSSSSGSSSSSSSGGQVGAGWALMEFRETNGGMLSGMTRYTDHLDDMPAIGYAIGSLEADRLDKYLLLLYGHAANYQGRGSFFTTEQQSLYEDKVTPSWRASLGEIQADFCTPSQTLIASMTAMMLVYAERDRAVIWLAKAAPRRWYRGDEEGAAGGKEEAGITLDFAQPDGAVVHMPTLMVRVRDPEGVRALVGADVVGAGSDCAVTAVRTAEEVVVVRPVGGAVAVRECRVVARWG